MNKLKIYPIYRLLSDLKEAKHAGISQWKNIKLFNHCSIGIEFHSPNYAYALKRKDEQLNWYHFEKFSTDQITAGILLIKNLMKQYHIPAQNILMHSDIAAWRFVNEQPQIAKTDPGAYFPMEQLAQNGIGIWPKFIRSRNTPLDLSIHNAQTLLKTVGYHLEVTNHLDIQTISSIKAFKIHFMPEAYMDDCIDDTITEKMIIGLENLIDQEYKYTGIPAISGS